MNPQQIFFPIIKTIHNLGSTIWVGGLIILVFVVIPTLRRAGKKSEETNIIISNIYKKLTQLIVISIPILFVTGILLARKSTKFYGFFHFTNLYSTILSIKIIFILSMIIIIFLRKKTLKKFMKFNDVKYAKKSEIYVTINMIIGILVIFLSYILTVV